MGEATNTQASSSDKSSTHPTSITYPRVRSRSGVKWDRYGPDVIASWVADMDFDPPVAVTDALQDLLDHGDLGYRMGAEQLAAAFVDWQDQHHGWRPDEARVATFTSALHALETALWYSTEPGDGVVVFTPIYYPFLSAIASSGRRRVDVALEPSGWRIDADRLEAAIDETTRVILFCNPHNPTGRVFDADEVAAVAHVAERHNLLVITDEIWGDLTYHKPHTPLAVADPRFSGRLVTLGSASKSFSLAGLRCAVAHIDNEPLNAALAKMPGHLHGAPSTLGVAGTLAAWSDGGTWLDSVKSELLHRRDRLAARLASEAPSVKLQVPEATYLAWLDFSETNIADNPSYNLLKKAGLALSEGDKFGPTSAAFARINFATSAQILDDAIDCIVSLVNE